MKLLALFLLLIPSLFSQGTIPFPGPGRAAIGPGTWAFEANSYNGQCVGQCGNIAVGINAAAGTYVKIWVFACGDVSCSTDPTVSRVSSIVSDGGDTIAFDNYSGAQNWPVWGYHITSSAGGSRGITVTFAGPSEGYYAAIFWSSYTYSSGTPATDELASGSAASGTTLTVTTAGTLDQSDELITALCVGSSLTTTGASFTALSTAIGAVEDEFKIGGTAGMTVDADCTQASSGRWHIMIATIKL